MVICMMVKVGGIVDGVVGGMVGGEVGADPCFAMATVVVWLMVRWGV